MSFIMMGYNILNIKEIYRKILFKLKEDANNNYKNLISPILKLKGLICLVK